ncbi:MAG: hypothetical protein MTP17_01330 [Candidatus Midichloria sp.]|nr:MAG: hypothetical protein MTP17_01330 [Candidatus Midichloria sp.]
MAFFVMLGLIFSFIYETSPPLYKAATYTISMCLSLELSNTINEYTEIQLKQEEAEKLCDMALDILSSLGYISQFVIRI